jgi:hypothetical protein
LSKSISSRFSADLSLISTGWEWDWHGAPAALPGGRYRSPPRGNVEDARLVDQHDRHPVADREGEMGAPAGQFVVRAIVLSGPLVTRQTSTSSGFDRPRVRSSLVLHCSVVRADRAVRIVACARSLAQCRRCSCC